MRKLALLLVAWLGSSDVLFAQDTPLREQPEVASGIRLFEAWIESQMAYRGLPGMTVAVVYDQQLLWVRGFGYADLATTTPADADTVYRVASNTKVFTSIALLKLRDAGKLRLDDPVRHHLPWFRIKQTCPHGPAITIRHLITHTSGLPTEAPFPYWNDFDFPTREELIEKLPEQATVFCPETRWKYSNLAFAIAGEVVAAASGQRYADYVQREILDPLGMADTTMLLSENKKGNLATGYGRRMPDGTRAVRPFTDLKALTAAGNLSSTALDLARFVSWQLRLRDSRTPEILRPSTLREMQRVHWVRPGWKSGWGFGFAVRHQADRDIVGHGGWIGGYQTAAYISPKEKVGVIVLTNADDSRPYPGSSMSLVDKAFAWIAPPIVKATASADEPGKPDAQWAKYVGKYRNSWGDSQVLIYDNRLVMISPTDADPSESMVTLRPVAGETFESINADGAPLGQRVVFELDDRGNVVRVKIDEDYSYPHE